MRNERRKRMKGGRKGQIVRRLKGPWKEDEEKEE